MCQTTKPASPYLDDPAAFAAELYSQLAAGGDMRVVAPARAEADAFDAAIERLAALHPELNGFEGPIAMVSEIGGAYACAEHAAGIRFGVVAEQLRRSLLAAAESFGMDGQEGGAS